MKGIFNSLNCLEHHGVAVHTQITHVGMLTAKARSSTVQSYQYQFKCTGKILVTKSDLSCLPFSSDDTPATKQKLGTLLMQYPSKNEGKELKIVVQPETQHRARYLTEGSRGSVKDRDQQGFPTVKVIKTPDRVQLFKSCLLP